MSFASELVPAFPVPPMAPIAAPDADPTAAPTGDWMPPATVDPTASHVPPIITSADAGAAFDAIFSELVRAGADDAGLLVNSDLLRECDSLRDRVLSRLTEQREKVHAGLAAERDAAYATCRHLLDEIERLANEYGKANSFALAFATSTLQPAAVKVNSVQQAAPARSTYPSKAEVERWRAQLRAAEIVLLDKQQQHRELAAAANEILERWQQRKVELKQAQEIEQRLTAQLEGKAYRDPKLGLYVAPTI
jgi:hypothetical protein